jgi:hypothetical protein
MNKNIKTHGLFATGCQDIFNVLLSRCALANLREKGGRLE